ncbi:MAG: D-sedoheptulose 7-phosphate isomerase [Candidatus Micrarchaeota archaeon]
MKEEIGRQLIEGAETRRKAADECAPDIEKAAKMLIDCLKRGNKLLICGNGGSAADSQHIAAELVWRFKKERQPLPAIALTTDTSAITAIANDASFDLIFSRQIEALASKGDVLFALSTSGNSKNVLEAANSAKKMGVKVVAFTGRDGGKLKALSDICICVPADGTDRIQEVHIAAAHIICGLVEEEF